jgi:hypothetical protein
VLHLAPEHLGSLTMTVDVRAGAVHLTVAGSEAALGALRDGLGALRDQLGQAGLALTEVSLRQEAGDGGRGHGRGGEAPATFTADGGGAGSGEGRPTDGRPDGRPDGPGAATTIGAATPAPGGTPGTRTATAVPGVRAGSLDVRI